MSLVDEFRHGLDAPICLTSDQGRVILDSLCADLISQVASRRPTAA